MKRSIFLLVCMYMSTVQLSAKDMKGPKGPITFNAFVQQYVPASQQETFVAYYERRIKQWAHDKRTTGTQANRSELTIVRDAGHRALQIQMPEVAHEVGANKESYTLLCMRYGMYEQFLQEQKQQAHSFMAKARSYFRGVRYKLGQWMDQARSLIWRNKTA
ncbi:MAG: hypothetical protein WCE21_02705 [Candidatus Babeliales bacterium]